MKHEETVKSIEEGKILTILRDLTKEQLIKTCEAMNRGGITLAEVAFSATGTPSDEEIAGNIRTLAETFAGKVHIGAGTVLTVRQVELAHDAGAEFIASPDINEAIIRRTCELGMVSIPGAFTPSEATFANRIGADFIKLFPNGEVKPSYLKALSGTLSHIRFIAASGVHDENIGEYLSVGATGVGIATGIVNKKMIADGDYEGITTLAKKYVAAVNACRFGNTVQKEKANQTGINLHTALDDLQKNGRGGKLAFPAGNTTLSETLRITEPCIRLEGEIWGNNADPNGVFEARGGSKIRLDHPGFPAIEIGKGQPVEGFQLYNFGIQGDLYGMDTRQRFSFRTPRENAGILFASSRTDQGECRKLSFCGLGVGACAEGNAELDACRFTDCNFDGCAVGVYFAPRAAYYSHIIACVFADNPYCGLFADGKGHNISNLEVTRNHFVRNGGAFTEETDYGYPKGVPFAAVCFHGISNSLLRDNLIDFSGTFWYYSPDAVSNDERKITHRETLGLYLEGDGNRIVGNTFRHSSCASVLIRGNKNLLLCNTVDGDVVLDGVGNIVRDLVFISPSSRLILKNPDALDAEQSDVPASRITVID